MVKEGPKDFGGTFEEFSSVWEAWGGGSLNFNALQRFLK